MNGDLILAGVSWVLTILCVWRLEKVREERDDLKAKGQAIHVSEAKLVEALEVAKDAMDERRGYAEGWDWKYGEAWDKEDAQVNAALAAYKEGK